MPTPMAWNQLLSARRQGDPIEQDPTFGRTAYQRDFDRIVYSSAFRRLQDKTQVFPLSKSDFVRTRLTHSLEASCIGRSLGTEVARRLNENLPKDFTPPDMGSIVAAACLAHDIGNPPFGHSGEAAIRQWFKGEGEDTVKDLPEEKKKDFETFEGNAQGFRILTRLQNPTNSGLHLTYATLAALTKYPMASHIISDTDIRQEDKWKKYGYFQAEIEYFKEVAERVGLLQTYPHHSLWSRHPLAFLVEAADDIAYLINDFEDGFRLKCIQSEEVISHFKEILGEADISLRVETMSDEDKISHLRGRVINTLIDQVATCFMDHLQEMMRGGFHKKLTDLIPKEDVLKRIREISQEKIYSSKKALEVEVPAFAVLAGLLREFISAVNDVAENRNCEKSKKLVKLIPPQFLNRENQQPGQDNYTRILQVTDFVSGMTDSFAVSLYKQITGISLRGY
ncbi:MAG: deoxyguanosinetriphosphate triphosphohydrolase [Candidatus Manganitrophaceae bacterium]